MSRLQNATSGLRGRKHRRRSDPVFDEMLSEVRCLYRKWQRRVAARKRQLRRALKKRGKQGR